MIVSKFGLWAVAALIALSHPASIRAAGNEDSLDQAERVKTVEAIATLLADRYTFPETGQKMAARLRDKLMRGEYSTFTSGAQFAQRLTLDLREISRDKHLGVRFSPEPLAPGRRAEDPSPEQAAAFRESQRRENGGADKVEILEGNIGYLHLTHFGLAEIAGPRLAAAMEFLQGADALIVDLRNNGGAVDPGSIAILCSYFFPPGRVHLNSLHWREGSRVEQSWTLPLLPGARYLDRPVYLLTSGRTFSGAEEFAYNLQTRKRAILVGERTGGGANPGGETAATEHFAVWVPTGRAENPVTGKNWEGVGVEPEVPVKAGKALLSAHKLALESSLARCGTDEAWASKLKRQIARLEEELNRPVARATFNLDGFTQAREAFVVGSFNNWSPGADPLTRGTNGWLATLELEPGKHSYKFLVDGEWMTDPANPETETTAEGHINSILLVRATAR